jgi:hypothetical protein
MVWSWNVITSLWYFVTTCNRWIIGAIFIGRLKIYARFSPCSILKCLHILWDGINYVFDLQHWETFVEIELQGYPHPLPMCHPYKVYIYMYTYCIYDIYIYIYVYISIFLSTLIFILIPFQGQHTISSGWYIAINIWHYPGISYLKDIIIIHCPYNTIIHDIYVDTFINWSSCAIWLLLII